MEVFMRSKRFLVSVLGLILLMQGCGTVKGARKGFKEDWKTVLQADDWMRENMW